MKRIADIVFPVNRWLEPVLMMAIIAGVVRAIIHLFDRGYLPQPFFYDPYDMWMDWFNTSWHGHNRTAYGEWNTIYPPLSFIFLNFMGDPQCYRELGPFAYGARDCDWFGRIAIHVWYGLNVVLTARFFYQLDKSTALVRSVSLSLCLPMLGGLERGNLILPTFTAYLIAFGPFVRSARLRWLAVAVMINFKVYLIAVIFPHLIRRRWRWFEGALITTVVVYILTYLWYGDGSPIQIYNNIVNYPAGGVPLSFLDVWFASTYQALLALLTVSDTPIPSIIGSYWTDTAATGIRVLTLTTQLSVVAACAAAWLRPEAVPMLRLTLMVTCFVIFTVEASGYVLFFPIMAAFCERWEGFGRKFAIIMAYIGAFPFDIIVDSIPPVLRDTYFGNTTEEVQYHIMLLPFLRPGLLMLVPISLACVTIRQVWQDIDRQAWKQRWRFRRDLPIMVGEGQAEPPRRAATPR